MTNFSLNKTYDIVLCLFSSIGYVRSLPNVIRTLRCFIRHLNKDGIIVVEPWFTPDTWNTEHAVHMLTAEIPDGKICRMNLSGKRGSLSIVDFHYLVGTKNRIRHFSERHELGLFSVEELQNAFKGGFGGQIRSGRSDRPGIVFGKACRLNPESAG